tara:strand:+ start:681 stop:1175 length:495 start_codon:yes stop_codon:yes gene_type:complete
MKFFASKINNLIDKIFVLLTTMLLTMITILIIIILGRFLFAWGNIAIQEFVMYLHATIFMLGICYVCKEKSHVSIDIFSRNYTESTKIKIDLLFDFFFLIPFSIFIIYISFDMVASSWNILEGSGEAGGLDYVYLLKTLIPITGLLILLSCISNIIDNFVRLKL